MMQASLVTSTIVKHRHFDDRQIDHQQTQFNINIHASPPIKQHMENTFS